MRELLDALADLFLPSACAGCGRGVGTGDALCGGCAAALIRLPGGGCPACQGPTPTPPLRCPGCKASGQPLEACVAEIAFAGPGAEWIRRFKYPSGGLRGLDPRPAPVVTSLAAQAARRLPAAPRPDLLIPVPLHSRRLGERGFHPAGEIARALGRSLGIRVNSSTLMRVRDTRSQTGLDRAERRRNVAGAFRPRPGIRVPRCVCLVDDVVTTGSTLSEAARALRRAGARQVVAVCVARTPAAPWG